MKEGISPVKEFDVSDVEAEMEAEKKKKEGMARGSKPEIKKPNAAEKTMAKVKENLQKREQDLAQARENLKKISNEDIDSALGNLEEPEDMTHEAEEIN
jgi:hypothetical protein